MYPVIYKAKLSGNTIGFAKGPVVVILEAYKGNEAILQHELTHVKQWAALSLLGLLWAAGCYHLGYQQYAIFGLYSLALHNVLYTVVPAYKQWAEVQAYRKQISLGGSLDACALSLSQDYRLPLSFTKARELLSR